MEASFDINDMLEQILMGSTEKTFGITYNKKLIWPPCLFLVVMLIKANIAKVTASGKYPSIYTVYDSSKY